MNQPSFKQDQKTHDELQRAVKLHKQGKLDEAEVLYRGILKRKSKHFDAQHLLGLVLLQAGNAEGAAIEIFKALKIDPTSWSAHNNRGNALRSLKRYDEAVLCYDNALKHNPACLEALVNKGHALRDDQKHDAALDAYAAALSLQDNNPDALVGKAQALQALGRHAEAIACFDAVIAAKGAFPAAEALRAVSAQATGQNVLDAEGAVRAVTEQPDAADNHYRLGLALKEQGDTQGALAAFKQALALDSAHGESHAMAGLLLQEQKRLAEALVHYDLALQANPSRADIFMNMGMVLRGLRRYPEAINSYLKAIALQPDYAHAYLNLANVMLDLKKPAEAVASLDRALAINPDDVSAWNNRGAALKDMKDIEGAIDSYDRAYALNPDHHFVAGMRQHLRMQQCDWSLYAAAGDIAAKIRSGLAVSMPFPLVALPVGAEVQQKAAALYVAEKYPARPSVWQGGKYHNDKIRIAYLSADFHRHATAYLMAGMFECHDKGRFETVALSFGPNDDSDLRRRLEKSFSQFIDVSQKSDDEIAQLIVDLQIDIAVDLKGFTQDARPNILSARAAPVQVSYLGYPGTMSAPYIDYIIADPVVLPDTMHKFFSEKVVTLPDSYQVNDNKRDIAAAVPSRADCGLPADAFVFCAFNSSYKITPEVFDIWMRLLQGVAGSVLWLLDGGDAVRENLAREAAARGVDPARLVFAPRTKMEDHLARHVHADLFLDNLPCNAHTTASDALWAGVPVLTCLGDTFAGRVAGSLLYAVGLPDMVTRSAAEYESTALALATNPEKLAAIKTQLAQNIKTAALFDTPRFTKHIEAAFETMHKRAAAGEMPESFCVPPIT